METQHDSSGPAITSISGVLETRLASTANWTAINPLIGRLPALDYAPTTKWDGRPW